jgi:hypothetical protein
MFAGWSCCPCRRLRLGFGPVETSTSTTSGYSISAGGVQVRLLSSSNRAFAGHAKFPGCKRLRSGICRCSRRAREPPGYQSQQETSRSAFLSLVAIPCSLVMLSLQEIALSDGPPVETVSTSTTVIPIPAGGVCVRLLVPASSNPMFRAESRCPQKETALGFVPARGEQCTSPGYQSQQETSRSGACRLKQIQSIMPALHLMSNMNTCDGPLSLGQCLSLVTPPLVEHRRLLPKTQDC